MILPKNHLFRRGELDLLEERAVPAFFSATLTTQHVDLGFNYTAGKWQITSIDTNNNKSYPANKANHWVDPSSLVVPPNNGKYNFIGNENNAPVFLLPQTQNPALLYLGIGAEGTDPSSLASWTPIDPRVSGSLQWIQIDVTAVRGPGAVSVYDFDANNNPRVWLATSDGLGTSDKFFVPAGGHLHYNWAFTKDGVYELDMRTLAYLGPNQTQPTRSEVTTFYFSVDTAGPRLTVPSGTQSTQMQTPLPFSFLTGNPILVNGPTTNPAPMQVTLSAPNAVLRLTKIDGLTSITGNESSNLVIRGTQNVVNNVLNSLFVIPVRGFSGQVTLSIEVSDLGEYRPAPNNVQTANGTVLISVSGAPAAGFEEGIVPGDGSNFDDIGPGNPSPTPGNSFVSGFGVPFSGKVIAIGADVGSGPLVRVFDSINGTERLFFFAYDPAFRGGVRVASADLTGDRIPDIITAPGFGGGPHVKIFNGSTGNLLTEFMAFDPNFRGGLNIATADLNGDGTPDILVGAGAGGGPHVKVFDGRTFAELSSFFAFEPGFRGGVNVAGGNLLNGKPTIVAAPGVGGGPLVRFFDLIGTLRDSVYLFNENFRGGANVAVGDINGDGRVDLIAGAGPGGAPQVRVYANDSLNRLNDFFALGFDIARFSPVDMTGARVAVIARESGRPAIAVASASGGSAIRIYDPLTERELAGFAHENGVALTGVYIGGSV